jgi:hypothetical protein
LSGRVTDPEGKPVSGAFVWTAAPSYDRPLDGVLSAVTDPDGRFAITDLVAFDGTANVGKPLGNGAFQGVSTTFLTVQHPNFAQQRPGYTRVPGTLEIKLEEGGTLEGRVFDAVTGKPAPGVLVSMQGTNLNKNLSWHETLTDRDGKYRFTGLAQAPLNIWAAAADRTCAALDSVQVVAKETTRLPDLKLVEGSWIEGRVVTTDNRPVSIEDTTGRRVRIGLHGPSRPESGAAVESVAVDDEGRFRIRVPAGLNRPYIMSQVIRDRMPDKRQLGAEIQVRDGETATVTFRVVNDAPPTDADREGAAAAKPAADEFPLPVPTERAVAQRVRDLGGWYELDTERHVVEVNMVYHYDDLGERHENEQKTDEILVHIDELPRLKRLLLTETQASDKGLEIVGRLRELEELVIWDPANVTDKGAAGLRKLPKLKFLLLSGTAMTDEGVAHLAEIASLETLYISDSTFTDKALEYASRLPRLKALDIANYTREHNTAITAAGMKFVREMPLLEELGVPFTDASDEALQQLYGLKTLKRLILDDSGDVFNIGARVKAAVSALQKANPNLEVIVSGDTFPSMNALTAASDPKQQEINRREGADGLKAIERFLELMWARRDAEALPLADPDVVADYRRWRQEPGFKPLRISAAYGDSEKVLVVTTPPVTYMQYQMDGEEKRAVGKKTEHVVLTAIRKKDAWHVDDCRYQDAGSDALIARFLAARPGAQKLDVALPAGK